MDHGKSFKMSFLWLTANVDFICVLRAALTTNFEIFGETSIFSGLKKRANGGLACGLWAECLVLSLG